MTNMVGEPVEMHHVLKQQAILHARAGLSKKVLHFPEVHALYGGSKKVGDRLLTTDAGVG